MEWTLVGCRVVGAIIWARTAWYYLPPLVRIWDRKQKPFDELKSAVFALAVMNVYAFLSGLLIDVPPPVTVGDFGRRLSIYAFRAFLGLWITDIKQRELRKVSS